MNLDSIKIVFIGDVFAKVGKDFLLKKIKYIKDKYKYDFLIINGENSNKDGKGINRSSYDFFVNDIGADAITLGNHSYKNDDIFNFINDFGFEKIVRPLNFYHKDIVGNHYGFGTRVFEKKGIKIRISNFLGTFGIREKANNSPYVSFVDNNLDNLDNIHIIDFHAESTAEKITFASAVGKNVSAIIGTHTHVQTNDGRILRNKCYFISDAGMTGSLESSIGVDINLSIEAMVEQKRVLFDVSGENNGALISGVFLEIDTKTKRVIKHSSFRIVDEKY